MTIRQVWEKKNPRREGESMIDYSLRFDRFITGIRSGWQVIVDLVFREIKIP